MLGGLSPEAIEESTNAEEILIKFKAERNERPLTPETVIYQIRLSISLKVITSCEKQIIGDRIAYSDIIAGKNVIGFDLMQYPIFAAETPRLVEIVIEINESENRLGLCCHKVRDVISKLERRLHTKFKPFDRLDVGVDRRDRCIRIKCGIDVLIVIAPHFKFRNSIEVIGFDRSIRQTHDKLIVIMESARLHGCFFSKAVLDDHTEIVRKPVITSEGIICFLRPIVI